MLIAEGRHTQVSDEMRNSKVIWILYSNFEAFLFDIEKVRIFFLLLSSFVNSMH